MSRNPNQDFTQYVHEYVDNDGKTRYAVARWNAKNGQFTAPLDARTRKLTGCSAESARSAAGIGGYLNRQDALRRARYLFSKTSDEQEQDRVITEMKERGVY